MFSTEKSILRVYIFSLTMVIFSIAWLTINIPTEFEGSLMEMANQNFHYNDDMVNKLINRVNFLEERHSRLIEYLDLEYKDRLDVYVPKEYPLKNYNGEQNAEESRKKVESGSEKEVWKHNI